MECSGEVTELSGRITGGRPVPKTPTSCMMDAINSGMSLDALRAQVDAVMSRPDVRAAILRDLYSPQEVQ